MKKNILKLLTAFSIATGIATISACSDDIEYTTAKDAQLFFETDTVSFDTIFTETTSVTERFCVYNRNSKHVRIKQVRLESGGQSSFMINADGQSGNDIGDISVGNNDSIFVFVKARLDKQSSMSPQLVSDNIIFTLENGNEHKVRLEASGQDCQTLNARTLSADTAFSSSSLPIVVYDSLVIAPNATLTIEAGTTVYFHSGARLIVRGGLVTRGTADAPVVLRGDRLDRMFTFLPYDRINDQWGGVQVAPTCRRLSIDHTDIHSCSIGLNCIDVQGDISVTNSIIHNISSDAIHLQNCSAVVANTQLSNAKGDCLNIIGGNTCLYHCTLAQFKPETNLSQGRGHALTVHTSIDETEYPVERADFYNCLITGYADDEVYCYKKQEEEVNLNFYNCVVLTNIADEKYFHNCVADSKKSERYKETNFRTIDPHSLFYDFSLDSLSTARGKGSVEYSRDYPTDLNGVARGESPDAGCYQYVPQDAVGGQKKPLSHTCFPEAVTLEFKK